MMRRWRLRGNGLRKMRLCEKKYNKEKCECKAQISKSIWLTTATVPRRQLIRVGDLGLHLGSNVELVSVEDMVSKVLFCF